MDQAARPAGQEAAPIPTEGPTRTIQLGETRITLLGTAHVSRASAEEVTEQIRSGRYDAVAVELCPSRYRTLTQPEAWGEMDLFRVIREGRAGMLASHLALTAYQQRLADQLGVDPGAEMRSAIDAAEEADLPLWCVDREVGTTLKRLLWGVPWTQRLSLMGGLLTSFLSRDRVTEEEIERLKEGDWLESTFGEFAERSPLLYEHLVQERDRYMVGRLRQELEGDGPRHVLVVIGAGHLAGMAERLEHPPETEPAAELAELDRLPPKKRWLRAIPWVVVAAVVVGFVIGFQRSPELGLQMVGEWVLINGGLSALGAALAGAHILTILGAFLAAPLTSLNPTVGAGMVVAAIEAGLRRPRVADFTTLRNQVTHLQGWWKNRVARILLVFVLSTLGSAVGTYLAGFRIIGKLV
ncbi:TraB/GumN family protein [Thiohalorhabdus denitrificans]|uniref:Pheromone shutdown-related protein TraB n=1 Tax=Thiohalorhabdus denitrificans TaxID=381306 RepID=A0A1G5C590_9GAMM|nr:TraB/GumN family protein [Thiohalorhabdus denitrificans]SCX97474.1 pheromone shutdown-related protein TraB [Thiohalorhabdus denitrificans]